MALDGAGNLYGTTSIGGIGHGVIYQLKRSGSNWIFNTLYSFGGGDGDGDNPYARVVFGPNGTLSTERPRTAALITPAPSSI